MLPVQDQTANKVSHSLVNVVEYLAAKEAEISFRIPFVKGVNVTYICKMAMTSNNAEVFLHSSATDLTSSPKI